MLFKIEACVSEEKSSHKPFFDPLASRTASTTSEMVSLTCAFSPSFPKRKLFAITQEIDSLYLSQMSLREAITSLHFLTTLLFFDVDPKFGLLFVFLIELLSDDGECKGVEEKHGDPRSEDEFIPLVCDSRSAILACRDFNCSSRELITAFLSTSSALSRAEHWRRQVFPPESKSFASWGSRSNATEFISLVTEVNREEVTRPSGGIFCMRRSAAHNPNVEATYTSLGILAKLAAKADLACCSSRAGTLCSSPGNLLNTSLSQKSVGRVPFSRDCTVYHGSKIRTLSSTIMAT